MQSDGARGEGSHDPTLFSISSCYRVNPTSRDKRCSPLKCDHSLARPCSEIIYIISLHRSGQSVASKGEEGESRLDNKAVFCSVSISWLFSLQKAARSWKERQCPGESRTESRDRELLFFPLEGVRRRGHSLSRGPRSWAAESEDGSSIWRRTGSEEGAVGPVRREILHKGKKGQLNLNTLLARVLQSFQKGDPKTISFTLTKSGGVTMLAQ